jgi:hypothetical protein
VTPYEWHPAYVPWMRCDRNVASGWEQLRTAACMSQLGR